MSSSNGQVKRCALNRPRGPNFLKDRLGAVERFEGARQILTPPSCSAEVAHQDGSFMCGEHPSPLEHVDGLFHNLKRSLSLVNIPQDVTTPCPTLRRLLSRHIDVGVVFTQDVLARRRDPTIQAFHHGAVQGLEADVVFNHLQDHLLVRQHRGIRVLNLYVFKSLPQLGVICIRSDHQGLPHIGHLPRRHRHRDFACVFAHRRRGKHLEIAPNPLGVLRVLPGRHQCDDVADAPYPIAELGLELLERDVLVPRARLTDTVLIDAQAADPEEGVRGVGSVAGAEPHDAVDDVADHVAPSVAQHVRCHGRVALFDAVDVRGAQPLVPRANHFHTLVQDHSRLDVADRRSRCETMRLDLGHQGGRKVASAGAPEFVAKCLCARELRLRQCFGDGSVRWRKNLRLEVLTLQGRGLRAHVRCLLGRSSCDDFPDADKSGPQAIQASGIVWEHPRVDERLPHAVLRVSGCAGA
mmetsp:Transcript_104572/g.294682  ORF Transcript_104572/g.294682 Transcript_104572/m.294682 type:complete len:467 (-) Transcript_104572:178-1578(-)